MLSHHKGIGQKYPERLCNGPLALHVDKFEASLYAEGYALATVRYKCRLVIALSHWLMRQNLALAALNETHLRNFISNRRRRVRIRPDDLPTLKRLLKYLRDLGCVARLPQKLDRTATGKLTRDFETFLRLERGLSSSTIVGGYLPRVRRFLGERFKDQVLCVQDLRPHDLHCFILHEAQRVSRGSTKMMVSALRSFLRFLLQRGAIKTDLAASLPAVANPRLRHLPKSLPPEQVERLLEDRDRSTPSGWRDYAVLLLLARLGLRPGEVASMTLDDMDWERGEIVVHGKGSLEARLPVPRDVGKALVDYLRHARPTCSTRTLFIRINAPMRGLGAGAISSIVSHALKRGGLNPALKGASLLRHSLATNMLRRGATLREIGQLLRHAHPATTQIYAKVDIEALRGIAPPWIGGAS